MLNTDLKEVNITTESMREENQKKVPISPKSVQATIQKDSESKSQQQKVKCAAFSMPTLELDMVDQEDRHKAMSDMVSPQYFIPIEFDIGDSCKKKESCS